MGTSMHVSRTSSGSGGGGTGSSGLQQLIEKETLLLLAPNETKYLPIDVGFDRYEIRTLFVSNDKGNESVATIYDKEVAGDVVYKSLQEKGTYDIVNVPCEDKDAKKVCHLFLTNNSSVQATYRVIIKLTNLL